MAPVGGLQPRASASIDHDDADCVAFEPAGERVCHEMSSYEAVESISISAPESIVLPMEYEIFELQIGGCGVDKTAGRFIPFGDRAALVYPDVSGCVTGDPQS